MTPRFLLLRAWTFRRELSQICFVTILGSGATLAVPWLAGQLLGGLLGEDSISVEFVLGLLLFALVSLAALKVAVTILSASASGRILAALRQDVYDHVQSMSVASHEQAQLGDLLSLGTTEVKVLSNFLSTTLANLPSNLITGAGALVLLFLIDPVMALVLPLLVPAIVILNKLTARRLRERASLARAAEVDVFSMAQSDLEMLPAIKSFAREEAYRERYGKAIEKARQTSLAQARLSAFIGPTMGLIAALIAIGILFVGVTEFSGSESHDASELLSFFLYTALLTAPANELARTYGEFQWASGTLARLRDVLDLPIEVGYSAAQGSGRSKGAIGFENISFAYPGREKVLDRVTFEIAAGEVVALTGVNGIGKSTLAKLLLRFYEPDAGRITLDGIDIRSLNVKYLRSQIGYVPQRALLFHGSVHDNIAMSARRADREAVERAAKLSGAYDFINELPQGLETLIGDKGVRLSGGQRQRVALARALFADPPIYVFDEATSMYDAPSEAAFIDDCVGLLQDKTIILISHRPATLAAADRILVASPTGYEVVESHDWPSVANMQEAENGTLG